MSSIFLAACSDKKTKTTTAHTTLREVAGAADPATRVWRARYLLLGEAANSPLGATVSLI